ncbi:NUDIX hydrolase [Bifidobacterium sp.]|jgi:8-oxo-dGTP pyrophosphatase MutT (NUDIX family)|uniref:NUDIX hydrolase n=1 Tax=Bifidobacterium sp. TaxID=41200 RepID=UPI003DA85078
MVESMITPADLVRMLGHAADDRAQNPLSPDQLRYTSQSTEPGDSHNSEEFGEIRALRKLGDLVKSVEITKITEAPAADGAERSGSPTPAMMPARRSADGPATFASLDAQELPVVREYSAGGLVFDELDRVAIIARHSRSGHLEWCLPKGHIEKGETPRQTAVREVHEETGILGEVVDSIATIDYWFTGTNQRVHKLVHHFALRRVDGELSVEGDPDHEAEDAIWVQFGDLDNVLSYPNERKIAWLYARKLNRRA